ncbi:MAG TPA: hypothetical protein VGY56_12710 [Verrucomicrobiae bacterium]|nr:hypothetical protein [Verrucomicrobiae bacterium]
MHTLLIQNPPESKSKSNLKFDWMANTNPLRWRGKKVLNRKNGQTYTVRDVMPRGSVELEKRGVLFTTNVQAVRQDYEPASP